jgi:hypothetical protein
MSELFREGGPFDIRKTGRDQFSLSVPIPKDADGRIDRECPCEECSPGYFKVKPGTGLSGMKEAFCPYCRHAAPPNDYHTKDQIRFVKDVAAREAHAGMARMLKESLGLDSGGSRRLVGGLINVDLKMEPVRLKSVSQPFQDILKRDILCPHCTLDHSVFGLATWCADCGKDIFATHVQAEINVIKIMMGDVERRKASLGLRVAARDIENGLEDLVSVFEATLKIEVRRFLRQHGFSEEDIELRMKKMGSRLQSVTHAETLVQEHCGIPLSLEPEPAMARLTEIFEKRHPITHNLGVVDRKYLEKVRSPDSLGKEVSIDEEEIIWAANLAFRIIDSLHSRLFPNQEVSPGMA